MSTVQHSSGAEKSKMLQPPSLMKATSTIEKVGSEETTAANSKQKANTTDSFLRPPSPST